MGPPRTDLIQKGIDCDEKTVIMLLTLALLLSFSGCKGTAFPSWNKGAASLQALLSYVDDVTDQRSEHYIPPEDRIAVFDMDGTLIAETLPIDVDTNLFLYRVLEDENYQAPGPILEYARQLRKSVEEGAECDFTPYFIHFSTIFGGMTTGEFEEYAKHFAATLKADHYENLLQADAWFKPMVEIVDYLNESGFKAYICSGTERPLCRILAEGHVNIPPERIIGRDVGTLPSSYLGDRLDSYEYTYEDELVRTGELTNPCWEGDKANEIYIACGKQPVLVFGNSSGDTSMAVFATDENPYETAVFMLMNDDAERGFGNLETYQRRKAIWDEQGWNVISIKNDFRTLFGDDVKLQ